MNRLSLALPILLASLAAASLPVAAATLEYTFSVPYDASKALSPGTGAGTGRQPTLAITCAVGPTSLGFSTATGGATNSTGSGTTTGLALKGTATVVVTVDAEPRAGAAGLKAGAGGLLQPVQATGFYTCWGTLTPGTTPLNFLPTTALPKLNPKV